MRLLKPRRCGAPCCAARCRPLPRRAACVEEGAPLRALPARFRAACAAGTAPKGGTPGEPARRQRRTRDVPRRVVVVRRQRAMQVRGESERLRLGAAQADPTHAWIAESLLKHRRVLARQAPAATRPATLARRRGCCAAGAAGSARCVAASARLLRAAAAAAQLTWTPASPALPQSRAPVRLPRASAERDSSRRSCYAARRGVPAAALRRAPRVRRACSSSCACAACRSVRNT